MTSSRFLARLTALKLAGATALSAALVFGATAQDTPVTGGTLVYLEQQTHTNLYPHRAVSIPIAVLLIRSPTS